MQKLNIKFEDMPNAIALLLEKMDALAKLVESKSEPPKEDAYLTRKQVKEQLHVSLTTLDKYVSYGVLNAYKIGRRTLFKKNEVEQAFTKKPILN